MEEFMTISQVVDAARNDVNNSIANGTMKKEGEDCGDDDENIYTIESLYSQWAENEEVASNAISTMFEEEFPEYL
jgi:hypothetical protein